MQGFSAQEMTPEDSAHATVQLRISIGCIVILVREAIRRKKQDPVEAQGLATLNQYLGSSF